MQALIVIDIQNDYFKGGKNCLFNTEEVAKRAKKVIDKFREKKLPIIHIQHLASKESAFFNRGTVGAEINEIVKPINGEKTITKGKPSSFLNTELDDYLKKLKINDIVLVGMMSHYCVDSTARSGKELGYSVTVIEDCCTTMNVEYMGELVDAKNIHAVTMINLKKEMVNIIKLEDFKID